MDIGEGDEADGGKAAAVKAAADDMDIGEGDEAGGGKAVADDMNIGGKGDEGSHKIWWGKC